MIVGVGTKPVNTKRMQLRQFRQEDANHVFQNWANDDEVTQYLSWLPHRKLKVTEDIIAGWIRGYRYPYNFNWAIEHKADRMVIGSLTILNVHPQEGRGEIGYCIGKQYWGQGLMTEALRGILDYSFSRAKFHELTAKHDVRNAASGAVMRKCGMQYVRREAAHLEAKGSTYFCDIYRIDREGWKIWREDCAKP